MSSEPPATIEQIGASLADALADAIPRWVEASVDRVVRAWTGREPDADVLAAAADAARLAGAEVTPKLRALLASDIDEQRTTPLALVREAVRYPAAVLRSAGVPGVERDRFAEEAFPDDDYDLTPANLADVDPGLGDLGLAWGAAKAWEHRRRHEHQP
jgi:hypothetical protein